MERIDLNTQASLIARMKTLADGPFREPVNVEHPYYKVIDDITDYTKKITFEDPYRSTPLVDKFSKKSS